jgi:hypothetical protein
MVTEWGSHAIPASSIEEAEYAVLDAEADEVSVH